MDNTAGQKQTRRSGDKLMRGLLLGLIFKKKEELGRQVKVGNKFD